MPELTNEKELEDFIYENPIKFLGCNKKSRDCENCGEDCENIKLYRQVNLSGYGVIDLLMGKSYKEPINTKKIQKVYYLTIIELKKGSINTDAILQVCRYRRGLERFFEERGINDESFPNDEVYSLDAKLIGKNLNTNSDAVFLLEQLDWLSVYEYSITLDGGISFQNVERGWFVTNEDFKTFDKTFSEIMGSTSNAEVIPLNAKKEEEHGL